MNKKILTRVKLINWHYFENETINITGTTLLSGENSAGKSTILDAMQFCMTTEERNFNKAANQNSKRTVKSYVRCKTGTETETYYRHGSIPAYVAMEFFEETENRYFILGVYVFSRDEDSDIDKKWFILDDCRFEDCLFITEEEKPALSKQFLVKGEKVSFIENKSTARERIKTRFGYLEERFFDLTLKSISFKPVSSVKEFINTYVLASHEIQIDTLRANIDNLSDMEKSLEKSRRQAASLSEIAKEFEDLDKKEYELRVNEIMLKIAQFNATADETIEDKRFIEDSEKLIQDYEKQLLDFSTKIKEVQKTITALNVDKENSNASAQLIDAESRISRYTELLDETKLQYSKYKKQVEKIRELLGFLAKNDERVITKDEYESLLGNSDSTVRNNIINNIISFCKENINRYRQLQLRLGDSETEITKKLAEESQKLKDLEKNISNYPNSGIKLLKGLIEKEYQNNGIQSEVYVLCDLLEINDSKWADAVEAYFNTQKFNLIVEPEYYNLALDVYTRNKKQLHSVGIINTKKLPVTEIDELSLANVVDSDNSAAKLYANYVLGRVIRCENTRDLENYSIAITPDCCLYQGYVSKYLNPATYKEPFIGEKAKKIQKKNLENAIKLHKDDLQETRDKLSIINNIINKHDEIEFNTLVETVSSSENLISFQHELDIAKSDYEKAKQNPDLIRIITDLNDAEKKHAELEKNQLQINTKKETLSNKITERKDKLVVFEKNINELKIELSELESSDFVVFKDASDKYEENRRTKTPKIICENFGPRKQTVENEKNKINNRLIEKQTNFNNSFGLDFKVGIEEKEKYLELLQKLENVDIVTYKEKIIEGKKECEEIFKTDFLSKMKELIENAKTEFKQLNKALNGIEYGEDSYYFDIGPQKNKESLYRMIMSDNNLEGGSLWTSSFEEQYKQEMEELFAKLTVTNDTTGEKVLTEYTDYRSYLDFEIVINKKNGSSQKLSKVLSEKSGGETQVPFYIAIAASFYQLYSLNESVRLMLLDEAFNNMDSERIKSVMELFKKLELQVFLIAPSPKIEDIGEHVDSVLTAIRDDHYSYIEEYVL
jgi:DNA repair exonuclease SbcCD ATPase subunit